MLALPVVLALLASAVAHAGWNAIMHAIHDKILAMALIAGAGGLCAVPLAVLAPAPARAAWPFLAASVVVEIGYNLFLVRAYRLGDFGQMYPLARGSSPLLVTLAAALFVGEVPTPVAVLGVAVIAGSLSFLVLAGRHTMRVTRPALVAAIATGLTIATYTTIDGVGVRRSGSAAGYVGWLIAIEGLAFGAAVFAVRARRPVAQPAGRSVWLRGIVAGALSVFAYGTVLWAQTRGALGPVAALRETSVIAAAVIGTLLFKEPFGRARILATIGVALGVLLLAIG